MYQDAFLVKWLITQGRGLKAGLAERLPSKKQASNGPLFHGRGSTMKTATKLGIVFCMAGVFSYAETWNGKLIDAACFDSTSNKPPKVDKLDKDCAPSVATTSFAVIADGKVFK